MEPKFMISEVFGTSWKYTKSQIWVLVGLFIGYFILERWLSVYDSVEAEQGRRINREEYTVVGSFHRYVLV